MTFFSYFVFCRAGIGQGNSSGRPHTALDRYTLWKLMLVSQTIGTGIYWMKEAFEVV